MTNSIRVNVVQSFADRRDCERSLNPSARDVDDRTLIDFQSNTDDSQLTSFWNKTFQYIIMDTRITLRRLDAKNFHFHIHHHLFEIRNYQLLEISTTANRWRKKKLKPKEHVMSKCLVVLYMKFKIRREKNNYFCEVTKRWRYHFCDIETHRWQWRFYLHVFQRTKEKTWRLVDCSERHIFLMI